jgi:hypothetical protein
VVQVFYRGNVVRNHFGSHPAFPLQPCFKPLHVVRSMLFTRQVKTGDCASLDGATLVADSDDVTVICLLPSDSSLLFAACRLRDVDTLSLFELGQPLA